LRCCIVEQHHDMHITRHAGHFKILELVSVRGQPSVCLLPLSSPALPLFICTFPIPLHHPQGPHSKADDSCIQSPTTFQKPTHRLSSTPRAPLCSYPSRIGRASDALGLVRMTPGHPLPSRGHPFMGGLVL
jgi:hypothetical protein